VETATTHLLERHLQPQVVVVVQIKTTLYAMDRLAAQAVVRRTTLLEEQQQERLVQVHQVKDLLVESPLT